MTGGPTDFREMWRRTVDRYPDRAAIKVMATGARTSYVELHQQASAVARSLVDSGTRAGHLVGLRTADRQRFCVGLLGAWLADAVPVPLSATAPDAYVDRLTRRIGVSTMLIGSGDAASTVCPDVLPGRPARDGALDATAGLAYVMHTSGSTGRPKPVALSHRALAAYCMAFTVATGLSNQDRFVQLAPVTFDVVFEELLPIWSVGGTAVLAAGQPDDPGRLIAGIEEHGITVAELTTVYWALLVRYLRTSRRRVPPSLRLLLMGGEPASVQLIQESLNLGLPLVHVYGVTEAGITSTVHFLEPGQQVTKVVVGKPLSNTTIYVVDTACRAVPQGTTGEILIGGDSLAEGYLDDPQATAHRFLDCTTGELPVGRYYRTGDAGRLTERGELEILGRLDAQVKVNGARVDLTEVEAALASAPLVAEAAVVAVDGPDGGRRLVGFAAPTNHAAVSGLESTLRQFLVARLPQHLVPERIIMLDALPITDHGKVDRQTLGGLACYDADPPDLRDATASQRHVAAAWTAATGRAPDSLDQSFGDVGGDSLALLAVVVALHERGFAVTSADCLTHPTVRALAAFLDRSTDVAGQTDADADPASAIAERRRALRREHLRRRRASDGSEP